MRWWRPVAHPWCGWGLPQPPLARRCARPGRRALLLLPYVLYYYPCLCLAPRPLRRAPPPALLVLVLVLVVVLVVVVRTASFELVAKIISS